MGFVDAGEKRAQPGFGINPFYRTCRAGGSVGAIEVYPARVYALASRILDWFGSGANTHQLEPKISSADGAYPNWDTDALPNTAALSSESAPDAKLNPTR